MSWVLCPVSCSSAGVSRCLSLSLDLIWPCHLGCLPTCVGSRGRRDMPLAYICKCYAVPWPGCAAMVRCCPLVLPWWRGRSPHHLIRGRQLHKSGAARYEVSAIGTFPWAMTGRDKLRQDMAGLGRTGHSICLPLSVPMFLMVIAMRRHSQQVYALAPTYLTFFPPEV